MNKPGRIAGGDNPNRICGACELDVDVRMLPSQGKLLLCSDGLCGEVSDAKILAIMNQELPPGQIADQLISAALEAGGWDNISVIVAEFKT